MSPRTSRLTAKQVTKQLNLNNEIALILKNYLLKRSQYAFLLFLSNFNQISVFHIRRSNLNLIGGSNTTFNSGC